MSDSAALTELARRHGIDAGYHDIWGAWHALAPDTARALLDAMGVDARDDSAVRHALAQSEHAEHGALLPPVLVTLQGDGANVPVRVAADVSGTTLRWRLDEEDGASHEGTTRIADLKTQGSPSDPRGPHARLLELPPEVPTGYHRLQAMAGDETGSMVLIVAPRRCRPVPAGSAGERCWGVSLQLYALRSGRNWGLGDFGDLRRVVDTLAGLGADMVGLNPLHALFPDTPSQASPYSPSSRRFLNPAYLDVEAMDDFTECEEARARVASEEFRRRAAQLRATELVDYEGALALKFEVLRLLYAHFRERHLATGGDRAHGFRLFCDEHGEALTRHAIFEAVHAAQTRVAQDPWPAAFLDSHAMSVAAFARDHADEVQFACYLQWQTSLQLAQVAQHADARGMRIGLYLDLAVGSDSHGADPWADPELYAANVSIGAPPDDFNLEGQVWGLPPWTPRVLRERAYAPFVDVLRANMRHAGALRIDHVLGLLRLFWVPSGRDSGHGAYVRYPLRDLLAITALESARENCVVVGEDLGTTPDELRAALAEYGLLSYRVLYFERHWHAEELFRASFDYPRDALVTVSTHDLATFAGFWTAHDLELRRELDLYPDVETAAEHRAARDLDRRRLLGALEYEDLRPPQGDEHGVEAPSWELVLAVHRFLARTPAALLSVQMEDVLGQREQANVPGTVQQYPNWRRKLSLPVEDWAEHEPLRELAEAVRQERSKNQKGT